MPDKRKLDDLLAQQYSPPPIRRGEGVKLSTDLLPAEVPSPAEEQPILAAAPTNETGDAQGHKRTRAQTYNTTRATANEGTSAQRPRASNAQTHKRTNAQVPIEAERVTRVSQGQRLRVDLIRALKQIALDDNRKLYQVMEEAIEEYVQRRRRSQQ